MDSAGQCKLSPRRESKSLNKKASETIPGKARRRAAVGYLFMAASPVAFLSQSVSSFVLARNIGVHATANVKLMSAALNDAEDDISRQLKRAREVLAKSKAKIEASESSNNYKKDSTKSPLPFFASPQAFDKKEKVIKSQDEKTGLFTTDGEMMAKMSESEEWVKRPLLEVFKNENENLSSATSQLAERDVAASIYNLQKVLRTEDYQKIFDSRNRFIGDN